MKYRISFGAVIFFLGAAGSFAQTVDLGRNQRTVRPGRQGVSALEFDLDGDGMRLGLAEFQLRLPGEDSAPVRLQRKDFQSRDGDGGFWRGTVGLRDDSEVMLTLHEGFLAGTIRMGTDLYEVRPTANGHVVEKIDPASYPACAGSPEQEKENVDAAPPADLGSFAVRGDSFAAGAAGGASVNAAGAYTIDILTVYTPEARAAAGGPGQMAAIIQAAVDAANQAFANSGVNAAYRLVRTAESAHSDTGNINTDLSWLASDAATATLRNEAGADLVSLVVENGGGYCGVGYVMRSPGPGFASAGFQVTARNCAVGNLSFAHEHGHNLGLEHDAANGPAATAASYPWSFGHLVNGVFRTVMSYASACPNGCTRVAYFSNPNVSYLGYPTGVANVSDNARSANATVSIVSAFRLGPVTAPTKPGAPTGLTASPVSSSQINLTWTDNANNETAFKVERSSDGVNFTYLAAVAANVTTHSFTGLTPATLYTFRVRATNAAGDSENTNLATATTLAALTTPAAPTGLSATVVSANQITLTWTDNANNETAFKVERSSDGVNFTYLTAVAANVTTHSFTGLTPATLYTFRVRATNAAGDSANTNLVTATTLAALTTPAAPTGLNATAVSASQINLAWTDASSNETGFKIERSTGGAFEQIAVVGAGVTTYASTGLAAGTAYSYRVRSSNAQGESGYSNVVTATTQTPPPGAPSALRGAPLFSGSTLVAIRLNWGNVANESSYRLERCKATSLTSGCTYAALRELRANSVGMTDTGVIALGRGIYKYRIRAENGGASSAWVETTVNAQ